MRITKASLEDGDALTKLTIESKAHWDYSEEQIVKWIPDLTITKDYIRTHEVFNLTADDEIVGYYSFYLDESEKIVLDNLFVSPNSIGKGFGRELLIDFFDRVKTLKYSNIIVYSDPNSTDFYTHFGFEVIGKEPTSIKNRFLPILSKTL